jgi:hypothetical protein
MSISQEFVSDKPAPPQLIEHCVWVEKHEQFNYITHMTGEFSLIQKLIQKAEFMLEDYPIGTTVKIHILTPKQ